MLEILLNLGECVTVPHVLQEFLARVATRDQDPVIPNSFSKCFTRDSRAAKRLRAC
jgi:hypothetical protein